MVGTSPRSRFIGFWMNFNPFLSLPVEYVKCVESLFVGSTASEDDEAVVMLVIVHGAIGPLRGDVSSCGYLIPLHSNDVEAPDIVHVA